MNRLTLDMGYPLDARHDWVRLAAAYQQAKPFPHVVIDDFLERRLALETARALRRIKEPFWQNEDHDDQVFKFWCDNPEAVPQPGRDLLYWFNSGTMLAIAEKLTNIRGLLPDLDYHGGGVHRTKPGGRLSVHCDYNVHPVTQLHRRVNALYFLNETWRPEWGGQLELWSADMKQCVQKIEPVLNRLVLFTITDTAFHGVPAPVDAPVDRYSLALYYFTADRPESEKSDPHMALWQQPQA